MKDAFVKVAKSYDIHDFFSFLAKRNIASLLVVYLMHSGSSPPHC